MLPSGLARYWPSKFPSLLSSGCILISSGRSAVRIFFLFLSALWLKTDQALVGTSVSSPKLLFPVPSILIAGERRIIKAYYFIQAKRSYFREEAIPDSPKTSPDRVYRRTPATSFPFPTGKDRKRRGELYPARFLMWSLKSDFFRKKITVWWNMKVRLY